MTTPQQRWRDELEARELVFDDAFLDSVNDALQYQAIGHTLLRERLIAGEHVFQKYGDDAPDAVWNRWEALFCAWCIANEEFATLSAQGLDHRVADAWNRRQIDTGTRDARTVSKPQPSIKGLTHKTRS